MKLFDLTTRAFCKIYPQRTIRNELFKKILINSTGYRQINDDGEFSSLANELRVIEITHRFLSSLNPESLLKIKENNHDDKKLIDKKINNFLENNYQIFNENPNNKTSYSLSGSYGCGKGTLLKALLAKIIAENQMQNYQEKSVSFSDLTTLQNLRQKLSSGSDFSFKNSELDILVKEFSFAYRNIFHVSSDDFRNVFDSHLYRIIANSLKISESLTSSNIMSKKASEIHRAYENLRDLKKLYNLLGHNITYIEGSEAEIKILNNVIDIFNKSNIEGSGIAKMTENIHQLVFDNRDIKKLLKSYEDIKGNYSNQHCREVIEEMIDKAQSLNLTMLSDNSWPTIITDHAKWVGNNKNAFGVASWISAGEQISRINCRKEKTGRGLLLENILENRRIIIHKKFESFATCDYPKDKNLNYTLYHYEGLEGEPEFKTMLRFDVIDGKKSVTVEEKYLDEIGKDFLLKENIGEIKLDESEKMILDGELNKKFYNEVLPKEATILELKKLDAAKISVKINRINGKSDLLDDYLKTYSSLAIKPQEITKLERNSVLEIY